jgi:hypothetical protein
MRVTRTLYSLAAGLASLPVAAHPGHAAPALHVHDIDFAAVALAAALLAAAIGFGIRAAATHKRKSHR